MKCVAMWRSTFDGLFFDVDEGLVDGHRNDEVGDERLNPHILCGRNKLLL